MQSVALPASDHQNPEDIETGTFVIYSSHDDRPEARVDPFTTNDLKCIQSNLSTGGCLTSIHDPEDAVSWMEDNWNNPLLSSIRNSSCGGPFAWMLSPTKPALAIFGSNEPVVVNMAQSLADSSGFPVIIRPATDNPALTLLTHDPESHNGLHGTMRRDGGGDDPMIGDEGGPPESGNSGRNEGDLNDAEFDNGGGGGGDGGGDGDLGDGEFDNGGGGGGDDPGPLTIKDKWESPLHRTSVKLRLKVNKDNTYPVNISYTFKVWCMQDFIII
ncbi:hypothetical protein B0H19DRAFT_106561 [Mycena capillaripes]|nr:hypothetical protein B0H19DRAFT_106561 [Mycena capillaripes]